MDDNFDINTQNIESPENQNNSRFQKEGETESNHV